MRRLLTVLGVVALVSAFAYPVTAITRGGEPDDNAHPYVGLMVAWGDWFAFDEDGNPIDDNEDGELDEDDWVLFQPLWRCSGTLISPTVYVTAGHCTEKPATEAYVWFDEDVDAGMPDNGYPGGPASTGYHGTAYTHPLYNPRAFFLFDLGVVKLDGPGNTEISDFPVLAPAGAIDGLKKGRKTATLTAVGYGLQKINPVMFQGDRVRLKADLMVVNTKGVAGVGNFPTMEPYPSNSVLVSGDAKHGGTCFGDSGGPMLIGDHYLAAVTSFGLNGNCAGVGGGFRIDRALELGWINSFLD